MPPIVRVCTLSLAVLLTSATAWAQTEADDIRGRVKQHQKVSITDEQGRKVNGMIIGIAVDTITVAPDRARPVVIPYARIIKIDHPPDPLRNGAWIGFGVGAALGVMSWDVEGPCNPGWWVTCAAPTAQYLVPSLVTPALLGAVVGVAVDALIRGDRGIYRRGPKARVSFSPVLAHGRHGTVLTMSW